MLIVLGSPGDVIDGALAGRMRSLWNIVIENVGDDPATDPHGVFADSWVELRARYAREADLVVEGTDCVAIYIADPSRMAAVIETCIPLDEL